MSFALAEVSPLLVLGAALIERGRTREWVWTTSVFFPALIIAVTAFIGVFLAQDQIHALSAYRDLMIPVLLLVVLSALRLTRAEALRLVQVFLLVAAASAILGVLQLWTGRFLWLLRPEDVWWQSYKTGFIRSVFIGRWLRVGETLPAGLFATTMNFASYLAIPTLMALAIGWPAHRAGPRWARLAFWALLAALILTFSRSSLFTFVIGWFIWLAVRRSRALPVGRIAWAAGLAGAAVLGIIVSGVVSFDALGTVRGRATMVTAALALIRDHPSVLLTGGLTDLYLGRYYSAQFAHNVILYGVIQYGALATVAWLSLVAVILVRSVRLVPRPDAAARAAGLSAAIGVGVTVFVYAQTTSMLDNVQTMCWLSFWLAMVWQIDRSFRTPLRAGPEATRADPVMAPAG